MDEPDRSSEVPRADTAIASRSAFLRLITSEPDGDTVIRALVRGPLHPYGALTGTLFVPDVEEANLILVGSLGPVSPQTAAFRFVSLALDLPATRAYLTGQTLFLPQDDWVEQFPALSFVRDAMSEQEKALHRVMVCAPLLYQGVPRGVVNFSMTEERGWDYADYTYLEGMLAAVAMWVRIRDMSQRLEAAGLTGSLPRVRAAGVTDRQRVILGLLADGKSNEAIARALGYSISTVKNDLTALMSLLAARDRHEILLRARAAGLLNAPGGSQAGSEVQAQVAPGDDPSLA